jgi:hypothetical protein
MSDLREIEFGPFRLPVSTACSPAGVLAFTRDRREGGLLAARILLLIELSVATFRP